MSLADSLLSLVDRISTDFHSYMLCQRLFPALVLLAGESCLGLRPLTSQMESLQLIYPSESQLPPVGVRPALFASLPFLAILMWLLL